MRDGGEGGNLSPDTLGADTAEDRESGVPGEALIAEITEGLMLDRNGAISPGDYAEFSLFCGILPLLLALVALRR